MVAKAEHGLHRLVTGDYPRLQEVFVREVTRLRDHDKLNPLIVLVSSRLLGLHLRRFLAARGTAHINLRFLRLEDLAAEVAAPALAAQGRGRVPSFASEMIISTAADQLACDDKKFYFRGIADRPGFHQAALSTIEDLKKACLSPGDLKAAIRVPGVKRGINEAKVGDLLKLWKVYEERLGDHDWFDECDLMREAVRLVPTSGVIDKASAIIVYGFYDFNTLQQQLLQSCFQSRNTVCFVPYKSQPAFEYAEPVISWLKSNAFKEDPVSEDRSGPNREPVIQHLCDHLFSEGRSAENPEDAITIISAPGELREVRETIRDVVTRARRDEMPFHEVGILLRNTEPYAGIFREALDNLGFKPYMPEGTPLSATRSGRSLLLMLDILRHDFARRTVMEFTTFAKLRNTGAPGRDDTSSPAPLWDVISMEAGVVGGADEWLARLKRHCRELREEHDQDDREESTSPGSPQSRSRIIAAESLCEFIDKVIAGLTAVKDGHTWTDKTVGLIDAFSNLVEDDEHTGDIKTALEQLKDLDEFGTSPSEEEFYGFAEDSLAASTGPAGRFQRNGPAVLNLMASRGIPFRMVVLPGMVEKSFPPVVRQDAILLDDERAALNQALTKTDSGPLRLKARDRLDEERLLFRLAVGAAGEKLLITYPRIEIATARERLPSSLLLAAIKALSGRQVDFEAVERFGGFKRIALAQLATGEPGESLDRLEYDLAKALHEIADRKPRHLLLLRETCNPFNRALKLEAERWGRRVFTSYDGVLSTRGPKTALPGIHSIASRTVSPTRLETYARCPYRYLLESVMRIEPLVEPERAERISPLDRGKLIHQILWEFLMQIKKERGFPVRIQPGDRDMLKKIATRRFAEFEQHGNTGYPALWAIEQDTIFGDLDRFVEEQVPETEFLPAYFEVRYGMKPYDAEESEISTETPVPLSIGNREISIRGKIDRIDISPDGKRGRVIDYKSGRAYGRANDLGGGANLQLPLYMIAAEWILKDLHKAIRMEGAEYYHITEEKDKKRHVGFDRETLESRTQDLATIIDTIVDSIECGLFFASPGEHCGSCDYEFICGAYRHTIFEMKCEDPAARGLMKIRDTEGVDAE
ncbi:MAG: PD-(D/E)XK nuclease family protein [Candidatus Eisenbacteria bacterium]